MPSQSRPSVCSRGGTDRRVYRPGDAPLSFVTESSALHGTMFSFEKLTCICVDIDVSNKKTRPRTKFRITFRDAILCCLTPFSSRLGTTAAWQLFQCNWNTGFRSTRVPPVHSQRPPAHSLRSIFQMIQLFNSSRF